MSAPPPSMWLGPSVSPKVVSSWKSSSNMEKAAEKRDKLNESIVGLPARGNPEAPVTIVEFSDFQCPYCARGASTMDQLLEKYPNDVKLVFKHFPLGFHKWAKPAAIASRSAGWVPPTSVAWT